MTRHRYRVTVTPVEKDGLHCAGRCAIEFEQDCEEDWMGLIEDAQRRPGAGPDERTALVIGARLLGTVARHHGDDPAWRDIRAHSDELLRLIRRHGPQH
ncbi:DUF3861 family protein [Pseudoxanthomonas mexicana]|uniref:DUF3861 family protein n=1 Tax=Pseudoxanthomonas mexicana TaxID=128785 RepID=UPI00398AB9AB